MTGEQLIVFSDLNSSRLDHNTYDWQPAPRAIEQVQTTIELLPFQTTWLTNP